MRSCWAQGAGGFDITTEQTIKNGELLDAQINRFHSNSHVTGEYREGVMVDRRERKNSDYNMENVTQLVGEPKQRQLQLTLLNKLFASSAFD